MAEELSFTRAALRLFAAQSTVSAAVRALEDELGVPLFDRSTRAVALSWAGSVFLPEAIAVIAAAERARAVVGEASQGLRGTVRVGTMASISALDLPGLLGAFRRRHPLVDVQLQVAGSGSAGIAEQVASGRLDLGVVALRPADVPDLELRPFANVPYIVVLPVGHRLAAAVSVALADLGGENFVEAARGFGNRIATDRAFAELGISRRVQIEISDVSMAVPYARAISGVAVMPRFTMTDTRDVVIKPLADAGMELVLSFALRAGRSPSPAVSALLDLSVDFIQSDGIF